MRSNRKKANKNKYFAIIIVVLAILVGGTIYYKYAVKRDTSILSSNVEEQVVKLLDLSTVKYNYTNVVAYKDNKKLKDMSIPFTSKGFLIKYNGYIKAGVDLSTLKVDVKDNKSVEIILDKATILDNVINEEDTYIYDERESLFNQLKIQDLYDVLVKEKENMAKEVIDKGILNEAEENAEELLRTFLISMGFENIKINFK
ncbi:DUF4230 domain-containing protein [Anaerosalibacter sp. Marseille-P3206]|uniref:DUF4230 domain-containing protein n=1 Tax=Anaerosalibacter sp. Marseille-P3206 TaxID=1871005 RepID=UPI0013564BCA|nr:DUF4230 domain-containing protein [Anaerosalibacter sp. Marseille-P3206]